MSWTGSLGPAFPGSSKSYWKYDETAVSAEPWQEFSWDGTTGAIITDSAVELVLQDGGRGDAGGIANGVIVDPGGLAFRLPTPKGDTPAAAIPPITVGHLTRQDGLFVVPGQPGQRVRLRFDAKAGDADYRNEVGVIVVGADGKVGRLGVRHPRFLELAGKRSRRRVLFRRNGQSGRAFLDVAAGDRLLFYMVQVGTTGKAVTGKPGRRPRVFFLSLDAAPGQRGLVRTRRLRSGAVELAWEDVAGQGDRDFNDFVLTVRRA